VKIRATADSASGFGNVVVVAGTGRYAAEFQILLALGHLTTSNLLIHLQKPVTRGKGSIMADEYRECIFLLPSGPSFFFCTVLLSFLQFSCQNDEAHGASFFSLHHVVISNS